MTDLLKQAFKEYHSDDDPNGERGMALADIAMDRFGNDTKAIQKWFKRGTKNEYASETLVQQPNSKEIMEYEKAKKIVKLYGDISISRMKRPEQEGLIVETYGKKVKGISVDKMKDSQVYVLAKRIVDDAYKFVAGKDK